MRILLQPSYILHSRPFKDSSLILEVFSRQYGRISLLAKGVRSSKSRIKGMLQPFRLLLLSWIEKPNLSTFVSVEETQLIHGLHDKALISGLYMNELLMRLIHSHDACPSIFQLYEDTLLKIQNASAIASFLRIFEKNLLVELGYGLELEYDYSSECAVATNEHYTYVVEQGPRLCKHTSDVLFKISGRSLLALAKEELDDPKTIAESMALMRLVLDHYLGGKPLKTRDLVNISF